MSVEKCSGCGFYIATTTENFCIQCGRPAPKPYICECGAELNLTQGFCGKCGKAKEDIDEPTNEYKIDNGDRFRKDFEQDVDADSLGAEQARNND